MNILNGAGRTAIDTDDLSTFVDPPKHHLLRGPTKLYRFGDTRGRWWFNGDLLQTIKEDVQDATFSDVPRYKTDNGTNFARYVLAVSRDWNTFSRMAVLTLGHDEALDCFLGEAAPQPQDSKRKDGPILQGGMLQYLIYEMSLVPGRNLLNTSFTAFVQKWTR